MQRSPLSSSPRAVASRLSWSLKMPHSSAAANDEAEAAVSPFALTFQAARVGRTCVAEGQRGEACDPALLPRPACPDASTFPRRCPGQGPSGLEITVWVFPRFPIHADHNHPNPRSSPIPAFPSLGRAPLVGRCRRFANHGPRVLRFCDSRGRELFVSKGPP